MCLSEQEAKRSYGLASSAFQQQLLFHSFLSKVSYELRFPKTISFEQRRLTSFPNPNANPNKTSLIIGMCKTHRGNAGLMLDSGGDGLAISELGKSPEIVKALSGRGIDKLFPIQKAVLEPAMQGRDMIGRARTGTGKTLAFGIPIIDKIIKFNAKHGRGKNPLCLVLAPTRELARQVEKEFTESAPSLDTIGLYGGTPFGQQMFVSVLNRYVRRRKKTGQANSDDV
ncbi:unnamed protein product [Microthlaspi erraticum]|uniref:RNA helicase n=1 Tax=Microthlaspi erraticum TaxID=1685480 RepID=A0A6D2I3P0_9BRAS|nr:unnamed protein product [Microthlaspi erraticum]